MASVEKEVLPSQRDSRGLERRGNKTCSEPALEGELESFDSLSVLLDASLF